ncbi:MAG: FAD-dependent oxidoreductase [Planctomycetota bacterium]|nr:FAD-dependent oxidoreductase [Planctomycetota bacterium]
MTASIHDRLPPALAERLRPLTDAEPPAAGAHVLYWMHHAVRGHENPALDVARIAAAQLACPLLVYQGLGGGHRFDNDRHHTFILEGARDVRRELDAQGITHAFHLGDGSGGVSPLRALARDAALVVTEEFPVPPFPRWTQRLAETTDAPVWLVDTACVVPMQLVPRFFDRAFAFRNKTKRLYKERLRRSYPEVDAQPAAFDRANLPFEDVDLTSASIPDLVARCAIDHTVGPVGHTRGGSVEGYARWNAFRETGLSRYAARRNDAAIEGVSRMSAYLHHGHVSPFRLAREAAAMGGKGPEKYLDELFVWREVAHNLCFHKGDELESLDVLPRWARDTLAAQSNAPRDIRSWETLARGRTGDRLWDLCQASLVRHGELHNNVRMTWGKALPQWCEGPAQALERLIDLNHRFALDGSDPNSYGGLLWCLGLFDRPFDTVDPVLGNVRGRSTQVHARRLDLDTYGASVLAPASGTPLRVAVIGAGLSGLTCARTLADHGHTVRVFEKARGPGGRMSTRRADALRFDHGAQYFTVRDPRFARFVDSWQADGLVAPWQGTVAVIEDGTTTLKESDTARYVGVPGMNAICKHLAADLDVALATRVGQIVRDGDGWRLVHEDGSDLGRFDRVVVSAPAPQAHALLEPIEPAMAARTAEARMAPCYAAMVGFASPFAVAYDGAFVNDADNPLSWVARNGSKAGRPTGEAWVLHGSPEWSAANLELSFEDAAAALLDGFRQVAPVAEAEVVHLAGHRWAYALPTDPLPEACLVNDVRTLVACGDWCGGPRVEGAFLSGAAAAGRVLALA